MLEAERIDRVLRESDIKKASAFFGISESTLNELNDKCLLNVGYIRENLIREDWKRLTSGLQYIVEKNKAFSFPEVTEIICHHWQISTRKLNEITKAARKKLVFCPICGIRVEPIASQKTKGLCKDCFTKTFKV